MKTKIRKAKVLIMESNAATVAREARASLYAAACNCSMFAMHSRIAEVLRGMQLSGVSHAVSQRIVDRAWAVWYAAHGRD